jgi:hypothetical protein
MIRKQSGLFIICISLILFSCKTSSDTKGKTEIKLENEIGTVKLIVNPSFDKYNKAFSQSDCGCCCYSTKYQFFNTQVHEGPILDTIPYFSNIKNLHELKFCSFSISHSLCRDCFIDGQIIDKQYQTKKINGINMEHNDSDVLIDTLININGRIFSIIGTRSFRNNFFSEEIDAITVVGNESVTFFGQRRSIDTSNFVPLVFNMIKTIEIDE